MTLSTADPDTTEAPPPAPARLIIVTPPADPPTPADPAQPAVPPVLAIPAVLVAAPAPEPAPPEPPPAPDSGQRLAQIGAQLTAEYVTPLLQKAGINPDGYALAVDTGPVAGPEPTQLSDVVVGLGGFVTELGQALSVTITAATRAVHIHLPDRATYDGWCTALGAGPQAVRDEALVGLITSAVAWWGGWSICLYAIGTGAQEAP